MSRLFSRPPRREPVAPASADPADFSHLSIDLGRFTVAEIAGDRDLVRRRCVRAAHWLDGARTSADSGESPLRSSTCVLLDDYPSPDTDPATVFGTLLAVTEQTGLPVDYVARTAGLAGPAVVASGADEEGTVPLVAARLVEEPAPGADGTRPPLPASGWLCNGRRSPDPYAAEAMRTRSWAPPHEYAAAGHSIFLDVEVWRDEIPGGAEPYSGSVFRGGIGGGDEDGAGISRLWSPAILAASWLLLRLGQLHGIAPRAVAPVPHQAKTGWPRTWDEVPTVFKINAEASPLAAYRALSIAPRADLGLEHAVRLLLDAFAVDPDAAARVESRAADEGLALEPGISDRLSAIFYPPET